MIRDLTDGTTRRIDSIGAAHVDDIRNARMPIASFSDDLWPKLKELKSFLYQQVYRHHVVNGQMSKARRIIRDLFDLYFHEPDLLAEDWRRQAETDDETMRARIICDYIAGMTDRFAMEEHRRLFDISDSLV